MSLQRSRSTSHGGNEPTKTESTSTPTLNNAESGSANWALQNQGGFGNVAMLSALDLSTDGASQEVGAEEEAAAKDTDALKSPALQSVLSMNPKATEAQKAALRILDTEPSGPWQNCSWSRVQRDAAWRVFHPEAINQRSLSACGPAAIMHATITTNPSRWSELVLEAFSKGSINGRKCTSELLAGAPPSGMSPVDWMMLSGLRNSDKNIFGTYLGRPEDQASGIAFPGDMKKWLKDIVGVEETDSYKSYLFGTEKNTRKVSDLVGKHGDDICVMMLVRASGLSNKSKKASKKGGGGIANAMPNHWIRLTEPVRFEGDKVFLPVFTWGGETTYEIDRKTFKSMTYEYIVGGKSEVL